MRPVQRCCLLLSLLCALDTVDGVANYDQCHWVQTKVETQAMRLETQQRLREKELQLKRFRAQSCLRVREKERQNRRIAQKQAQNLDTKCAKVLCAVNSSGHRAKCVDSATRHSSETHMMTLLASKKTVIQDCALLQQMEKTLRLSAQARDVLLVSRSIGRTIPKSAEDDSEDDGDKHDDMRRRNDQDLLPKQRIALYATVRRRYMDHERQRVLANAPTNSAPNPKPAADRRESNRPLISRTKPSKSAADSSSKPQCCDCAGVFIVDGTTGPEVKVHKHSTQCSTPWRKQPSASTPATQGQSPEHTRFLQALQEEIGTPALCSCARNMSSPPLYQRPCANNCALYKQPKKREKLLASVYKQQQQHQSGTIRAASPVIA